jgi:hypothetical protein
VVEGALTALVLAFLQRSNPAVLEAAEKPGFAGQAGSFGKLRWLWIGLGTLVILSPLGLLAPGTAWGEWGAKELTRMGFQSIPRGLESLSGVWGAPLARYDLPALGNANLGYLFSAVLGVLVIGIVVWLFTVLLTRRP